MYRFVVDDRQEVSICVHLGQSRDTLGQTDEQFRRGHNQRLPVRRDHLSPEQVKVVGGRGRMRHRVVHIVRIDGVLAARAHLQEALDATRRVLGPRAVKPMRKQHNKRRLMHPLLLARAYVLIDDDLRSVEEVAELSLPYDQVARAVQREAVVEAHHGLLRQIRGAYLDSILIYTCQLMAETKRTL
jgi:hypothetical protein